jgi:hypothetical protein
VTGDPLGLHPVRGRRNPPDLPRLGVAASGRERDGIGHAMSLVEEIAIVAGLGAVLMSAAVLAFQRQE